MGNTLNSHQAASPPVGLVESDGETLDLRQGVLHQIWDTTEPNRIVTRVVLKATDHERFTSRLLSSGQCHEQQQQHYTL
ncbi:hypothetical protein TNCV_1869171 [Trichonephila clavipes]|nr:hypothetical protein TNCV_1869171 [Trichonephila clavipes]